MTVKQAQREIDSREFAEWMAEYWIEPWGELRADLRSGIIASVLANVNGNKTKPSDFMPKFNEQPKKAQTEEELAEVFNMFRNCAKAK